MLQTLRQYFVPRCLAFDLVYNLFNGYVCWCVFHIAVDFIFTFYASTAGGRSITFSGHPAGHCPLTAISSDALSLYLLEEFQ